MTGTTRAKLTRSLPRGYFADAQDHTLSTHGRAVTSESGTVVHSRGDNSQSVKSPAALANSTTALAGSSPAMGGNHFASSQMNNRVQGTGVPGAARDTGRTVEASPAGDSLPVGMDTRQALGVSKGTACGGLSSPQDCHEIAQQLRAARLLRL